jgi:hypothetical protein
VAEPALTVEEAATVILLVHQRRDIRCCICGWSELGQLHPAHQVEMLRRAGLLNDAPALT